MIRFNAKTRQRFSLLMLMPVLLLGLAFYPQQASAGSGDYPWANATEVNLANYDWGYNPCPASAPNCMTKTGVKNGVTYGLYDPWNYYFRNCTSYAAWRANNALGVSLAGMGNAHEWDENRGNRPMDAAPESGDIAQSNGGPYGHVGFVEKVNRNTSGVATSIEVAEFNKNANGAYTYTTYSAKAPDGKFWRDSAKGYKWDNFIDLNGTGVELGGGTPAPTTYADDIYAINRRDAGSGGTAAHVVNGLNWGEYLLHSGTALPYTDANWDFELGDYNRDGKPDLWAFNRNPGGARTVLHVLDGNNLRQRLRAGDIDLPGTNSNWDFELGDLSRDGIPDIYGINKNPGGGNTVVHVLNGANWMSPVQVGNIVLHGTDANWDFEVGKYDTDNYPDIYAINRRDAGSGSTAVHVINGSNWGLYSLHSSTALPYTDANWVYSLGDLNHDGKTDLYGINRNPGGSNTVVHVLDGNNLRSHLKAQNIVLHGTNADWDFGVSNYN